MILLYQITHNNTDTSLLDLFVTAPVTTTRGHNFKFIKPRCYSRCRQNFFSYRTIDNWNKLPPNVVNAGSINSFKNLDNFYSDKLSSNDDIQPSTVVSNQLPSGLVHHINKTWGKLPENIIIAT